MTVDIPNLVIILISLLVAVFVLVTLAKRMNVPYPIFLVIGGLVMGFVPFFPEVKLTQEEVFLIFLPPLLLWEALNISARDLRANAVSVVALAIGLVIITTVLVGLVSHTVIHDFSWTAAFVLGAVISPTDTVAASTIAQRLKLPGRIVSILNGESLFNDATGLVLYSVALSTLDGGSFSLLKASGQFVFVSVVGIAIGLVVGLAVGLLRRFIQDDPTLENVLLLLTGYIAYLLAETFYASGVLAVVAAGILLGSSRVALSSSQTRLQAEQFWQVVVFLLNSLLFILVGLQLHGINAAVTDLYPVSTLIWYALVVSLAVIVIRLVWVFLSYYFARNLFVHDAARRSTFAGALVIGWSGMRGGVSLAAVLALPANFPSAALVVFLVYCVILVTLVGQGLSLPWLIKTLQISNEDVLEVMEMKARLSMARAALHLLDTILNDADTASPAIESIHNRYKQTVRLLIERLGKDEFDDDKKQELVEHLEKRHQLQTQLIDAEREAVKKMREERKISDDIARRLNRELDLDEIIQLSRRGE